MLPAANRIRSSGDFAAVITRGKRAGSPLIAAYALRPTPSMQADLCKVGFVVSKKVGNSVIRHRVVRQLRHIVRDIVNLEQPMFLVIRAHPAAAHAAYTDLYRSVMRVSTTLGVELIHADVSSTDENRYMRSAVTNHYSYSHIPPAVADTMPESFTTITNDATNHSKQPALQ